MREVTDYELAAARTFRFPPGEVDWQDAYKFANINENFQSRKKIDVLLAANS